MEQKTRKKYIELEAARVCKILEEELAEIRYVKDWAVQAGCSCKKLQRMIQATFGISAKEKLKVVRFNAIKQTLIEEPDSTSYAVAVMVGLKNEREAYKFLSRNFDTSFSELKFDLVLKSENKGGGVIQHLKMGRNVSKRIQLSHFG